MAAGGWQVAEEATDVPARAKLDAAQYLVHVPATILARRRSRSILLINPEAAAGS